jgi:chromosome partitioning protein
MGKIINDEPFDPDDGILHHSEGVDLLPSNIELSGVEITFINTISRETILRRYINSVKHHYDYILLDAMPSAAWLKY